jgi:hypothetical protein
MGVGEQIVRQIFLAPSHRPKQKLLAAGASGFLSPDNPAKLGVRTVEKKIIIASTVVAVGENVAVGVIPDVFLANFDAPSDRDLGNIIGLMLTRS